MSEIVSVLAIEPASFSDGELSAIVSAVSLQGDQPIAQLAQFIRNFRRVVVPLESEYSQIHRESYTESLCNALYVALLKINAIDGLGRLDLERLRGWAQELHRQTVEVRQLDRAS